VPGRFVRPASAARLYLTTGDLHVVQRALGYWQITTTENYGPVEKPAPWRISHVRRLLRRLPRSSSGFAPRNDIKSAKDLPCLCEEVVRSSGRPTKQSPCVGGFFNTPLCQGVRRDAAAGGETHLAVDKPLAVLNGNYVEQVDSDEVAQVP